MAKNELRIDTEILISLIEEKRCIWDSSNEHYKDRDMKNKAFAAVAAVVVLNYDNMTEAKQREAVQVVQKRWRTARDAYRRDRNKVKNTKSRQAAKKYKTYIFYDNLKFLDQVMELNSTETNFDCTNTDEEETRDSSGESETGATERPTRADSIASRPTKSGSGLQKAIKNKNIDDKSIAFIDDMKKSDDDGDMAFFESLLPTLNRFDIIKKLQFRSEVLRIIMEIKNVPKFDFANPNVPQYTNRHPSYYTDQQFYNMSRMQDRPPYDNFEQHQQIHFRENYSRASSTTSVPTPSPASSNEDYVRPSLLQLTQTNIGEYNM
ncbi:uncharacterized protein [Leptinotarsa decemlineata]|uniref:uncharacterized protein n=1 Tax=Leptinotarsa decemlineata TaxID=7539 RepID=UPI003D30A896